MHRERLSILHLLSQRPESTGSGVYIQAMLREAGARHHRNFLLAGIPAGSEPVLSCISPDRCDFVRFDGVDLPHPVVGMSDVMPYPSTRFSDLTDDEIRRYKKGFTDKLKTVVARFRPDIVHSHHLWILTALTRQLFPDLPMVATCHGSDLRQFRNCPDIGDAVARHCRELNAVMALSRAQVPEIESLYGICTDRIRVTGAGYDESVFFPVPKPEPHPVQLVYAGKLSRSKGVPWLLRALSRMDDHGWYLHLVGGGSGKERDECLSLARDLGSRVTVHGPLTQEGLAKVMKQSHLFILPSFFEGLPLVLLEALACGCRLVSTALPGVTEATGGIDRDWIRLVELPRLHRVDIPVPDDEIVFEENLGNAVEVQMLRSRTRPALNAARVAQQISPFRWSSVFDRVERAYSDVAFP